MFEKFYEHCLDAKNRMRIPQKYRDSFGGKPYYIVASINDHFLEILSEEQVSARKEEILKIGKYNANAQRAVTRYLSTGYEVEEDSQGRFTLSQTLRSYAGIEKDMIIIRELNYIRIYSIKYWNEVIQSTSLEPLRDILATIDEEEKQKNLSSENGNK